MATGPQGHQGYYGPAGPQGATGITGQKGRQGTPYGPTGSSQFGVSGRIPYSNVSSITITVSTAGYGTHYVITNAYPTTSIVLPGSMVSGDIGAFWSFQNNSSGILTITLTNGTASYRGNPSATTIYMGVKNGLALVYSGSGTSYIVL